MVGLLIITHDGVGSCLLETAVNTLGVCPLNARVLAVAGNADPDALALEAADLARELDDGSGLLVLTDVYGSTPSNIAAGLVRNRRAVMVAGINLPMLIRILNYPHLDLDRLAEKAVSGGRDGVLCCKPDPYT